MRVVIGMCSCLCLGSLSGGMLSCAAEEQRMENQMDLTLGGNNPSLRRDLAKIDGILGLAPKQKYEPNPATEPVPEPVPGPAPEPEPEPEPKPKPEWRVVTLGQGETLWGLAVAHLGEGSRWRDIARLNGWSEAQAELLRAGTRVKLPQH